MDLISFFDASDANIHEYTFIFVKHALFKCRTRPSPCPVILLQDFIRYGPPDRKLRQNLLTPGLTRVMDTI